MRYLSMFSGIEAASVAWEPLGWTPAAFCEIEPAPSAVLAHHWPNVPNLGDVTKADFSGIGSINLAVFGSPCQSFSVAGKRLGLDDPRGNLALYALGVVERLRPRWFLFENVPGLLSSGGGRDFGAFLGTVGDIGYQCAWRTLDAQYFGVPQRRRRVFVVGHLGDWRRATTVLFERHSLSGNPPPRREKGQGTPSFTPGSFGGYREGLGTLRAEGGDYGGGSESLIAHSLRAEGFDASEDGTGRGTPLVPVAAIQERAVSENPDAGSDGAGYRTDGQAYTLEARPVPQAVAFAQNSRDEVREIGGNIAGALAAEPGMKQQTYVAFNITPSNSNKDYNARESERAQALTAGGNRPSARGGDLIAGSAVRRLTPRECERLQGFPDDFTLVPYRGKFMADGPRYKMLGNSMAVPVIRWIGERIQLVEAIGAESMTA